MFSDTLCMPVLHLNIYWCIILRPCCVFTVSGGFGNDVGAKPLMPAEHQSLQEHEQVSYRFQMRIS